MSLLCPRSGRFYPKTQPKDTKAESDTTQYQFIKTLAAQGNTVIATARNVADLENKIKTDNIPNTHVVQADLVSSDSLKAAAKATSSITNGQIDHLLINGAYLSFTGGKNPTDFADEPELFLEELRKSDEANIAGPLFAINAFLPLLRAGKEKRVTYISSGTADITETLDTRLSNSVPYVTSKAGGNIVIAKFAAELKDEGFIFLSIAPGGVATETLMDMSKCELKFSSTLLLRSSCGLGLYLPNPLAPFLVLY